jgi:polysaccharide deacetylase family protein (PEP-CTERM system associated)
LKLLCKAEKNESVTLPSALSNSSSPGNALTVDVEEWFHILDSPSAPSMEKWDVLESRVGRNLDQILVMLDETGVSATFFWLGWVAERNKSLVIRCQQAGHEIASHGYGHLLAYKVGAKIFREDIDRSKKILEDITGEAVIGFRAPGFGITDETGWAFSVIREVGYEYDSSVFPANRGHGGMKKSPLRPYIIQTRFGPLLEFPMSTIQVLGRRLALFGGGYLRLTPRWILRYGVNQLRSKGYPLIVYVHPREIDPNHPRLPLNHYRAFKSYVSLKSTMPKLQWLCQEQKFVQLRKLAKCCFV